MLAKTSEISPVLASTLLCVTLSPKRASNSLIVERNAMSSRFAGFGIVYVFVTNFDLVWLCMCKVYYGRHCDYCLVQWNVCY